MLTRKWFLFMHTPVIEPLAMPMMRAAARPTFAAHLCVPPSPSLAPVPLCNASDAKHVSDACALPGGFMLACIDCLALSELLS